MTRLSRVDREALERALAMACSESPEERARFEEMLRKEDWREVCETAAYAMQCRMLKLKCWQAPPCHVHDDVVDDCTYGHKRAEVGLRRRLLAAKLSLFEPDPIGALKRAESARRDERVEGGDSVRAPERAQVNT
jgi:hypothetical protein